MLGARKLLNSSDVQDKGIVMTLKKFVTGLFAFILSLSSSFAALPIEGVLRAAIKVLPSSEQEVLNSLKTRIRNFHNTCNRLTPSFANTISLAEFGKWIQENLNQDQLLPWQTTVISIFEGRTDYKTFLSPADAAIFATIEIELDNPRLFSLTHTASTI